jgi:hypothetical protein
LFPFPLSLPPSLPKTCPAPFPAYDSRRHVPPAKRRAKLQEAMVGVSPKKNIRDEENAVPEMPPPHPPLIDYMRRLG